MMRTAAVRRYQPLAVLAALIALVVAVAPSNGRPAASSDAGAAPAGTDFSSGAAPVSDEAAGPVAAGNGSVGNASAPGTSGDPSAPTRASVAGSPATGTPDGGDPANGLGRDPQQTGAWPWNHPWTLNGDRSRCAGDVQTDVINLRIPCVPRFTADNGGATYQGVTDDKVKIVLWDPGGSYEDEATTAAGLATTYEDRVATAKAAQDFFNRHYEFYGRTLEIELYTTGCSSPYTDACIRNDARTLNKKLRPFYTIAVGDTTLAPLAFWDEMSRLGVVNSGGWHNPTSFNIGRRPFHYDLFPASDNMVLMVTDYFCKKMVGKPASRAGDPTIQARTRKLGIVVTDIEEESADLMAQWVSGVRCGTASEKPPVITVSSDLTTQQQQMTSAISTFKNEGVTTVFCLCGAITPTFLTQAADQQQYFPEHLCCGHSAHDHDLIGRLFSQNQWKNAFGPGSRPDNIPESEQDNNLAWRDVGNSGNMCYVCWTQWLWFDLMAAQIQWAGPNLTPYTLERGALTAPQINGYANASPWPGWRGGLPGQPQWQPTNGTYTMWFDARQVRWDPTAISKLDGKPGAYVCVPADCRRTSFDGWSPGEPLIGDKL